MKINWFCPLLPEKTDIAHYTSRILNSLQQHGEILLWTDKKIWLPELEPIVRYYDPNNLPVADLSNGLNIYNIGNNAEFHGSIYKVSRQYPGIVIVHDLNLHYLFTSLYPQYQEPGEDRDSYVALMERCHGDTCKRDLAKFFVDELDWSTIAQRYPLTFAAVENALGVVVHTEEAKLILSLDRRCHCPVLYSPLPYPPNPIHTVPRDNRESGPPYGLIIFGYLGGTYRRVQSVLEALGTMEEKSQFRLDIYGQIWDEGYIRRQIDTFDLEKIVQLHGFVEEAELDAALANADLAFNLRYPTGGEASGSQLRIWSHGLPSLVTRIGWYRDLPTMSVGFVSHDREIEDLQQQLRNFLANPSRFRKMGQRGQKILAEEHNPALYAKKVVEFARNASQSRDSFIPSTPPKVSVIIPVRNGANYIKRAIESVLNQTYGDYEVIVVDDGSTDRTQEIVRSYGERLRSTSFQNPQGQAVAWNRGVEMARGELIAFLAPEDWFLPHKLEAQVAYFQAHTDIGLVASGVRVVNQQVAIVGDLEPWYQYPKLDLSTWVSLKPMVFSSLMLQRQWLEWVGGFDTNFPYGEDLNLLFRLALMNCQGAWLQQVTACHPQPNGDNNFQSLNRAKYIDRAMKNLFARDNLPELVKNLQYEAFYQTNVWLAWNLYATGHPQGQVKYLQKSLAYTDGNEEEAISDWVKLFRQFSHDYGYSFDAWELSELPEWKQLVRSLLVV